MQVTAKDRTLWRNTVVVGMKKVPFDGLIYQVDGYLCGFDIIGQIFGSFLLVWRVSDYRLNINFK